MGSSNRSVRGDVNVILNGLVRDGVIAGFSTNFGENPKERAKVVVVAGSATNPKVVKLAVRTALQRFSLDVVVSVKPG